MSSRAVIGRVTVRARRAGARTPGHRLARAYVVIGIVGVVAAAFPSPAGASGALLWSAPELIAPFASTTISRPSRLLCVAGGVADNNGGWEIATSTNPTGGGSAWKVAQIQFSTASDFHLSCPSVALCVGVTQSNGPAGGDVVTSTNPTGGPPASTATPLGGLELISVSCPSESLCVAIGSGATVATSTNPTGGSSAWNVTQLPTFIPYECGKSGPGRDCKAQLTSISCASVSLCVVVDSADAVVGDVVTSTNPDRGLLGLDRDSHRQDRRLGLDFVLVHLAVRCDRLECRRTHLEGSHRRRIPLDVHALLPADP
jgi:hypothetical protein